MSDPKPEEIAAELVSTATKTAEHVVQKAAETAEQLLDSAKQSQQMVEIISESLRKVFGENVESKRFVDITRIPLICQSIIGIHESLKDIKKNMVSKESFWPVKVLVYGAVGIILTAVMTALLYLVINK